MRLRMHSPHQRSIGYPDRINVTVRVSEERRMPVVANRNRRLHGGRCAKRPPAASGGGIERKHCPVFASHKDRARKRRWLSKSGRCTGKSKRPLKLETLDLLTAKT